MNSSDNILLNRMLRDEQQNNLENNLSMLAHDIKNPIGQVKRLIEIALVMSEENPELEMILSKALQSNNQLENKVEQILNLPQTIDDQNQDEVDFNILLENVKQALSSMEGYEHTKFIIRIDEGLKIFGSTVYLQSVFQNLIENSIKYRKLDVDRNIVLLSIHSGDKGTHIIKVTDNGRGIRKDLLPYIFDKNYKTRASNNGHGVGLHLVKQNLNTIGAKLDVESEEGEGTTFTIVLPNNQIAALEEQEV